MNKLIIVSLLLLNSCDYVTPSSKDTKYSNIDEVCLNGVVYYQTWSSKGGYSYSPKFNIDSKIETCYEYGVVND